LAGLAQNEPSIKISNIFATDNSNVRIQDGEVHRCDLRLPEIVDNDGNVIIFPRYIYDLINPTEDPNPSIVFPDIVPNNPSDNPSDFFEDIIIDNPSDFFEDIIIDNPSANPSDFFEDIDGEDDEYFTILGDISANISAGDIIRIMNSTYNDGLYTVELVSVDTTYASTRTLIYVLEDISNYLDITGNLWVGSANVVHQRLLSDDQQDEFLFLFTAYNIFRWDYSSKILSDVWTVNGSGSFENWSSVVIGNDVVATNNVDIPLIGNATDNFTGLDDSDNGPEVSSGVYISQAKLVTTFENYTLLGNVTLSNGTTLPSTFYNSDLNNKEEWNAGDAGYFDVEGNDHITGWGKEFEKLIIFKERSIHEMFFLATSELFSINKLNDVIGCKSPDSIINDADGKLYYLATDKSIKCLKEGEISQKIDSTIRNIQDLLVPQIRGFFINEFSELWWAIPIGTDATANNKIVTLTNDRIWNFINIPVSSFGKYGRVEVLTWKNNKYENWAAWNDTWNSVKQNNGFPIDLIADFSGSIYAAHESGLDKGSSFEGYFVLTTDLSSKQSLPIYKRLVNSIWYFRNSNNIDAIATIYIKGSNESSYTEIGSFSIYDSNNPEFLEINLPMDIRQKSFDIKISSNYSFKFIGCVLESYFAGDR